MVQNVWKVRRFLSITILSLIWYAPFSTIPLWYEENGTIFFRLLFGARGGVCQDELSRPNTHTHTQIIFPIRHCSLKLIYSCTHKYILFMLTALHHLNISNGAKWCRDNNEMRHKPQDILILQVTGSSFTIWHWICCNVFFFLRHMKCFLSH